MIFQPQNRPAPTAPQGAGRLAVNRANDPFEQEAHRMAEFAVSERGARPAIRSRIHSSSIQRERASNANSSLIGAPPIVDAVLQSSGRPLDPATRGFMEARLGHNFSRVQIHADTRAAASARAVNARAYTVGQNIVFASGEYRPGARGGRQLLAHELAHTIQQSGSPLCLQRACADLDTKFRSRQQTRAAVGDPLMTDPCRSLNPIDCCDEFEGCDRKAAAENARDSAYARLIEATSKLEKVAIGRGLRRTLRQLFGRGTTKRKVVETLREARDWLKNVTVPTRSSKRAAKGASGADGEVGESKRAAEPATDLGEAPLEEVSSQPQRPLPPEAFKGGAPAPGDVTTVGLEAKPRPKPCAEETQTILCAVPCPGSPCTSDTLAETKGGVIRLCLLGLQAKPEFLAGTIIHEAIHNVIAGSERDIYSHTRLFRVLARVRDDPKRPPGSLSRQNPDSYTALVLAATGIGVEEFIAGEGGAPKVEFEGFGSRPREKVAPEVALGFASAGIGEAFEGVESLVTELGVKKYWAKLPNLKETADALRRHRLIPSTSDDLVPGQIDRLRTIKGRLNSMKTGAASVRSIARLDSFEAASYAKSELVVTKRFFALNSQRSQTREIIEAFVKSAGVNPAELRAYVAFVEDSIDRAKGLSSLPLGAAAESPAPEESEKRAGDPGDAEDDDPQSSPASAGTANFQGAAQ